jgi:DNA-binding transcriptional regulator YhcF (GntR family)
MSARYNRIAAELRERIESGELKPGDRMPSTRDIVRQWGVAMATATKVITELRQEGLVSARPGVGTVVTATAPARPPRRATVGRAGPMAERIVSAAIEVADAEGLGAVSMRRVAAEIDAATMSLYRHVADKDALVLRMMDTAFAELRLPEVPAGDWRERLELAARLMWQLFRRHPWLAPAMSMTRPQLLSNAVPVSEWMLSALSGHGLDLQALFTAYITLANYVRGTAVNIEPETEAQAETGIDNDQWMRDQEPVFREILTSDRYQVFASLADQDYDYDFDELFEFGLQRLLDGFAVLLADKG